MFKSAKKRSLKVKERVDFKLEFHATRVPQRGWDKLMVSLISLDSNKVTSKTRKVPVKNGVCTWAEPVYESLSFNQDAVEKDGRKAPYKLLISMGLSRFGILGEATIDFADYIQADAPVSLSLQLQNCTSGSVLHVKIQQLGLNITTRDFESLQEIQRNNELTFLDVSNQCMAERTIESDAVTDKDECASTSCLSSDSLEAPQTPELSESRHFNRETTGREEFASPCSSIGSCSERQDLGNSLQDVVNYSTAAEKVNMHFSPSLSHTSNREKDRVIYQAELSEVFPWTNKKPKELEVAESTLRELSLQSPSVEQNSKQSRMQIELLQKQNLKEKMRNEELQQSLTLIKEECDSLRLEMHSLQLSGNGLDRDDDGMKWRELQEELKYEKSVNSNLSLQLRKTQESNAELLLEVQDLERLSLENEGQNVSQMVTLHQSNTEKDLRTMVESLKKEIEEQERDAHELTEENMDLLLQLKQVNDLVKTKEDMIVLLEMKVKNESHFCMEIESNRYGKEVEGLKLQLSECMESYENKLTSSRTLIDDLNSSVMMVRSKNACIERELQSSRELISELHKEVEFFKSKTECHEKERVQLLTHKGQLNVFREKANKAEQDYRGALKRVEELEALNRELKVEKTRDLSGLRKQLQDFQEHALVADSKCKDLLQGMAKLRDEKLSTEKEISTLLSGKEAAEANVTQLQSFNMVLQEKLHLEQGRNAELLQQSEEKDTKNLQFAEDVRVNMARLKVLEQTNMELESSLKEAEVKIGNLQADNLVCRSQIKEFETQRESLEEQKLSLESAKLQKSALESRLLELEALNDELSEKLKNAQEDIDWARENTNTLVNEIRELEGELKSDMVLQEHLKQSLSECESQKLRQQSQFDELSEKNMKLLNDLDVLKEDRQGILNDKDALLATLQEQKIELDRRETSLNAVIKGQEEKIQQLKASSNQDRIQQVLLDASLLKDEKSALEQELKLLQDVLVQAKKDAVDNENKVKRALLEASMRGDEKVELEENVLKLEQMLKQAEKDASSLKRNLDFQFQEYKLKEQDMIKTMNDVAKQAQILQDENLEFLQKVMGLEAQCAAADLEKRKLSITISKMENDFEALQRERDVKERAVTGLEAQVAAAEVERNKLSSAMPQLKAELEALQMEKEDKERALIGLREEKETLKFSLGTVFKIESDLEALQKEKDVKERAFVCLKEEKERLEASLQIAEKRLVTMEERAKQYADVSNAWEQSKVMLKESTDELHKAKQEIDEFIRANLEQNVVKEELQKQVTDLEEQLQQKSAILASMELKMNESENPMCLVTNCPGSAKKGSPAPHSSLEEGESATLHDKVKSLEEELKVKVSELELSRQLVKEKEAQLSLNFKQVDVAKEEMVKDRSVQSMHQHQDVDEQSQTLLVGLREDEHLSKMTSGPREDEHLSKMPSEDLLQKEIQSLQEDKRVLELALTNFSAAANNETLSKKLIALEMELAEVLEANNMYKKELQSAFAELHNVQLGESERLGNVEQVVQDLADLKRRNKILEDELKDMRERYFDMSLKFAEGEEEREGLVMTIRNLRGSRKLMPYRSANF